MNTITDNALMLKVKAGDIDKMSLLFERHSRVLFRFLFHMTQRREASEDMVQTIFYKMLKYRHTFTEDSNFTAWMYHIARNVIKDQGRKHQLTNKYEPIDDHEERIAGGALADEAVERKQSRTELFEAMQKLNVADREVLTLNRLQELKYTEIGEIMGITAGAVKVRVHRAIQELKLIYFKKERKTGTR